MKTGGQWDFFEASVGSARLDRHSKRCSRVRASVGLLSLLLALAGHIATPHAQAASISTNDLWLEVLPTGTNGFISDTNEIKLILHNALANMEYQIQSGFNVTTGIVWTVETNLPCPAGVSTMAVIVPMNGRPGLLFRAVSCPDAGHDGIPDCLVGQDLDRDGLPDDWEWKHFGNLQQTAIGDADRDGTSNYDEYVDGRDPNTISFTLTTTNQSVCADSAWVQLSVDGFPARIAVLVNSTNFESALWQPYGPTNFSVLLGTNNGDYGVWVGLRGRLTNSPQTWHGLTLTRDTVPPGIVVTNPAATVSRPVIQLQGLVTETLSSLTYDLTNAAGTITNEPGFITGARADTNTWKFTANYFQCYDVVLTNGVNAITLRATDLAGNTTSTNLMLSLDMSANTNPPVVTILWPLADSTVAGTGFTLRGILDDDTATVAVTGSGMGTVVGLVERGGKFSVPNLPLPDATNTFTIAATNSAGYGRTLQWTVRKSGSSVAMNPLAAGALIAAFVSVSGTIDNANQDVWVNGVQATVNPDGTWDANNVPVHDNEGTAQFEIKLYPPGADPADTSPSGMQSLETPAPPVVRASSYVHVDWFKNSSVCPDGTSFLYQRVAQTWERGVGGKNTFLIFPSWTSQTYAEEDWPPDYLPVSNWRIASSASGTSRRMDADCGGESHSASGTTTQTRIELVAGGPAKIGVQQLIRLTASVELDGGTPFSVSALQIPGQVFTPTPTNASVGETFLYMPTGSIRNLMLTVIGANNYTFNLVADLVDAQLAVDANRDAQLTFDAADIPTSTKPFRIWINDDQDDGDTAGGDSDVPGAQPGLFSHPNCGDTRANGRCDLIDFFPVALSISNALRQFPLTNGYEFHLAQGNGAVNFMYTDLTRSNAFSYQTRPGSSGYGPDFDRGAHEADMVHVPPTGVALSAEFLSKVQNDANKGVILIEGRAPTRQPLVLQIWRDGRNLAGVPLYLSVNSVERMYRWINLRHAVGQAEDRTTDTSEPINYPDSLCNGKNFVLLHGYNVTENEARAWGAETFKRMWWSGSRARFYQVTWRGDESKYFIPLIPIAPNYHINVEHAFQTAPALAQALNSLAGQTTTAAHSLGNMVVLAALNPLANLMGAPTFQPPAVTRHFALDAAVAAEALDGNLPFRPEMSHSLWDFSTPGFVDTDAIDESLWASEWFALFPTNDARHSLTWRNRFVQNNGAVIYNFYSTGEELLNYKVTKPTPAFFSAQQLSDLLSPNGEFSCYYQELMKGVVFTDQILGSDYGGWGFGANYYVLTVTPNGVILTPPTRSDVAAISWTATKKRTEPLFLFGTSKQIRSIPEEPLEAVSELYGPNGSSFARRHMVKLLADMIPARTVAMGREPIPRLDIINPSDPDSNFNLTSSALQDGWPQERLANDELNNRWLHSDARCVAYRYNHKLFEKWVQLGNLNSP